MIPYNVSFVVPFALGSVCLTNKKEASPFRRGYASSTKGGTSRILI